MVFTTQFDRLAPELVEDQAVFIRGMVLPEENAPPKISIQDIIPLEKAAVRLPSLISIKVWLNRGADNDRASQLEGLFHRKPGDTQVRLRLEWPREYSVILDVAAKVRPDKEFKAEVARICGPESIEVLGT